MRCLTDGCIVHAQVTSDRAHNYLARVNPNSYVNRYRTGTLQLVCILGYRLLHSQRRIAGAHCMILMGEWRAKESHDAIAHNLVNGSLIAMHRFHHSLQEGI